MGLSGSGPNASQQTSVEELLAFIEGDEGDGGGGVTAVESGPVTGAPTGGKSVGKRGKKKVKKPVSQLNANIHCVCF